MGTSQLEHEFQVLSWMVMFILVSEGPSHAAQTRVPVSGMGKAHCVAARRDITSGVVDIEAQTQRRERASTPVRAQRISAPRRQRSYEGVHCQRGMIDMTVGPEGVVEFDKDSYNYQKEMQDKKGYEVE
ncbi:hypothetical protein FNV43_RR01661 [Rhamnella rubrinervis]|uniref:Uncharacterized protein n=1 Tax=Rhamnella rubrinervis TaxID=2594499 RepID=A0A8K0HSV4_9ROSA|nr:hypothetical protein FNV43_RR01661 [Rhamnella rubrinervis]